jgi:hypothetical protein
MKTVRGRTETTCSGGMGARIDYPPVRIGRHRLRANATGPGACAAGR